VVEALGEVIGWHQRALLPDTAELASDPRVRLQRGDFFAMTDNDVGFDPEVRLRDRESSGGRRQRRDDRGEWHLMVGCAALVCVWARSSRARGDGCLFGLAGFEILAAAEIGGELELLVQAIAEVVGCPACGAVARATPDPPRPRTHPSAAARRSLDRRGQGLATAWWSGEG
jgi:hypothetical protein